MTVGEAVGEPVVVDEPTESVAVHIGANYSEKEVDVIFETAAASQTPVWTKVVEAKQQAGMELLGGFYWTKSNVSVKNDRFVLADKPSDSGLFFRHESGYGVPSDEATYAGTAYTPAPVQIAIDAIPQNEGVDPCSLIDLALRMRLMRNFRNFTTARTYSARRTALREWAIRAYRSSCPIAVS